MVSQEWGEGALSTGGPHKASPDFSCLKGARSWLCTPSPACRGGASPFRGPVPLLVWCPTNSHLSPQGSHGAHLPLPTGQGDPRARGRQGPGPPISGDPGKELGLFDPIPAPSQAAPLTASPSGEMVTDPPQAPTSTGPLQGNPTRESPGVVGGPGPGRGAVLAGG